VPYALFKTLHVLGVVLFLGNLVVTAVWKTLADRTREPRVVAFSQRLVTVTDIAFTGLGAFLILATGMLLLIEIHRDPWQATWTAWGLGLFLASGAIWAAVLIPIQRKQSRLARGFAAGGDIPPEYWTLARRWRLWGTVATVLPLVNLVLMVFKPL